MFPERCGKRFTNPSSIFFFRKPTAFKKPLIDSASPRRTTISQTQARVFFFLLDKMNKRNS